MKRKIKKKIIAGFLIFLALLLISRFGGLFSIFQPIVGAGNIYQYIGSASKSGLIDHSQEAIIKTPKSTFKFITRAFYCDTCCFVPPRGGANILGVKGCYYGIEVYKDGQLIENLMRPSDANYVATCTSSMPSIENMPMYSSPIMRTYADNGRIVKDARGFTEDFAPEERTGVSVQFKDQENGQCGVVNFYKLELPKDAIDLEFFLLKDSYNVGDKIDFKLKAVNKLNMDLYGNIKIEYELPTILGTFKKTEEKTAILKQGENIFDFSILASRATEELIIKPSVDIEIPTAGFSGVNIIFEDIGQKPYNYKESFLWGTEIENPKTIKIGMPATPSCKEGDIKNFACKNNKQVEWCSCKNEAWSCIDSPENQCKETNYFIFAVIILALLIAGLGLFLLLKKILRT